MQISSTVTMVVVVVVVLQRAGSRAATLGAKSGVFEDDDVGIGRPDGYTVEYEDGSVPV